MTLEEQINQLLELLQLTDAKLDAIKEQLDNQDEDIRILTEKVDEFIREDAYGSGFTVGRFDE